MEREATKGTPLLPDLFYTSGHGPLGPRRDASVAHVLAETAKDMFGPPGHSAVTTAQQTRAAFGLNQTSLGLTESQNVRGWKGPLGII